MFRSSLNRLKYCKCFVVLVLFNHSDAEHNSEELYIRNYINNTNTTKHIGLSTPYVYCSRPLEDVGMCLSTYCSI